MTSGLSSLQMQPNNSLEPQEMEVLVKEEVAKKLRSLKLAVEFRRKFDLKTSSEFESSTRKILWNYGIKPEDLPFYP